MKESLEKAQFGAIVRAGRRMVEGAKAAKSAYKVASETEKLNQIKTAKRAAAVAKAKATREANKVARIKAAEEVTAKSKRGRKPKDTTTPPASTQGVKDLKEVKVSASKAAKGKKAKTTTPVEKAKELKFYNTKTKKYEVPAKEVKTASKSKPSQRTKADKYVTRGTIGTGVGIAVYNMGKANSKSKAQTPAKKETPADTTPFKPKGVVKNVLKSAGRYKFANGGVTKSKKK